MKEEFFKSVLACASTADIVAAVIDWEKNYPGDNIYSDDLMPNTPENVGRVLQENFDERWFNAMTIQFDSYGNERFEDCEGYGECRDACIHFSEGDYRASDDFIYVHPSGYCHSFNSIFESIGPQTFFEDLVDLDGYAEDGEFMAFLCNKLIDNGCTGVKEAISDDRIFDAFFSFGCECGCFQEKDRELYREVYDNADFYDFLCRFDEFNDCIFDIDREYFHVCSGLGLLEVSWDEYQVYIYYDIVNNLSRISLLGDVLSPDKGHTSLHVPAGVNLPFGREIYWHPENISVDECHEYYKSENNCFLTKDGKCLLFGSKNSIIPDSVSEIGPGAFSHCAGLKEIIIPEGVVKICESAFKDCRELERITIPDSVTEIGHRAFHRCYNYVKTTVSCSERIADYLRKLKPEETGITQFIMH